MHRIVRVCAVAGILGCLAGVAPAQTWKGFATAPIFLPTAPGPEGAVTGDFNEDGVIDLATANEFGDNVSVLLGNGNGGVWNWTFASPGDYPAGDGPTCIALGDFNEDGITDLVVSNSASNNVSILRGNGSGGIGNGTFAAPVNYGVGSLPYFVRTGDFNEDGIPDIVTTSWNDFNVSILLGNGTAGVGNGTFAAAVNFPTGGRPQSVNLGDFNEDSILDLVTCNIFPDSVSVLLGNGSGGVGNGTFASPANYAVGSNPGHATTGDFNEDGITDLVAANQGSFDVSILLGNGSGGVGNGTFAAPSNYNVGYGGRVVTVGDFNGDGITDLATANPNFNTVSVVLGNGSGGVGNGSFGAPVYYTAGNFPYNISTGDFNEDGRIDLVVSNVFGGNVGIYVNRGTDPKIIFGIFPAQSINTNQDFLEYNIVFAETVAPTFSAADIAITGSLAAGHLQTQDGYVMDPMYRFIIRPANPSANGTLGLSVTGVVSSSSGTLAVPVHAPTYNVGTFPAGDVDKNGAFNIADVALLADANLGLVNLP